MTRTKEELEAIARSVPFWWHSIDLGQGVVTDGLKTWDQLQIDIQTLRIPDLKGKTVLDIGTYDGFFAFEAERREAKRVVALDHFVWSLNIAACLAYWRECMEKGIDPDPNSELNQMHPNELPGMAAYNTAHRVLESKVETVVEDFMEADLDRLGTFDVVLYLGVLYHMQNPFEALKRLAAVTGELAIIETEAIALPGFEDHALCEFFEGSELNRDPSNWWAPNEKAVAGMCRAAGFKRVEVLRGAPAQPERVATRKSHSVKRRSSVGHFLREFQLRAPLEIPKPPEIIRYRAVVQAWK
jgi:tRNA (mo5U34)-methyltransferase